MNIADLLASDGRELEEGFNTMRLFIERFYRSDMVQRLFFEADRTDYLGVSGLDQQGGIGLRLDTGFD